MTKRYAKKTEEEKVEEEVERNVRPSPKDKPPRKDKTRRHIEDKDLKGKDPDTGGDKDLSMNYKDIGGSVTRVANLFLQRVSEDAPVEDLFEDESEEGVEEGVGEDEEVEVEEDAAVVVEDSSEEGGESSEDVEEEEEPEPVSEKDIEKIVKEYESKDPFELLEILEDSQSDAERAAARKALKNKKNPLPSNWKMDNVFQSGVLTLGARKRLRDHIKHWSLLDFENNINHVKEHKLRDYIETGSEKKQSYYKRILETLVEEKKKLEKIEERSFKDLDSILPEDSDKEFKDSDKDALKENANKWRLLIKKMKLEEIEPLLQRLNERLNEIPSPQLTKEYAWLSRFRDILKGEKGMREIKESTIIQTSLRNAFRKRSKEAQYRGLPGPLDEDDGYKPPQPKWRKPDPRDLTVEDYALIVKEALEWLDKPFIDSQLRSYDFDMACRIALDYAIFDLHKGLYDGVVDTPTYNQLLGLVARMAKE